MPCYPSKVMMLPRKTPLPDAPEGTVILPQHPPAPCAQTHPSSVGLDLSGHSLNHPSSCPAASSPWILNITWEGKAGEGWE